MSHPPRYWSDDFIERFVEALNSDADFQAKARGFSETIILTCLGTPEGEDVRAGYSFDDGHASVDVWREGAPSGPIRQEPLEGAMARATAPYEIWCRLDRGEMGVLDALRSPDYSIDGSMVQIMRHLGVFRGMNEVAAAVDKTY